MPLVAARGISLYFDWSLNQIKVHGVPLHGLLLGVGVLANFIWMWKDRLVGLPLLSVPNEGTEATDAGTNGSIADGVVAGGGIRR